MYAEDVYGGCYRPLGRFLAVMVSGAARCQEKAWLDGQLELLREKVLRIEEMFLTDGRTVPDRVSFERRFRALRLALRLAEERYENILSGASGRSDDGLDRYAGSAVEFRTLSESVEGLVCEANGLLSGRPCPGKDRGSPRAGTGEYP